MFDCVLPTRSGRTGQALTRRGAVNLRNARHADDPRPLDPDCGCPACRRLFARLSAPRVQGRRDHRRDAADLAQPALLSGADGGAAGGDRGGRLAGVAASSRRRGRGDLERSDAAGRVAWCRIRWKCEFRGPKRTGPSADARQMRPEGRPVLGDDVGDHAALTVPARSASVPSARTRSAFQSAQPRARPRCRGRRRRRRERRRGCRRRERSRR